MPVLSYQSAEEVDIMTDWSQKTALVNGGSRGIGASMVADWPMLALGF